jgi:hypothetical protein
MCRRRGSCERSFQSEPDMQDNIDPQKSVVRSHLVNCNNYRQANGTAIAEGDYNGYRAVIRKGETRCLMAPNRGDNSYDWLDATVRHSEPASKQS